MVIFRAASSPLKTLEGHTKGILSLAWCKDDSDLLLSCGKDNRILVWNPNSPQGEIVAELPTSNQWSFDVSWCPRNPAVIGEFSNRTLLKKSIAIIIKIIFFKWLLTEPFMDDTFHLLK